jgi:hypothetical protein
MMCLHYDAVHLIALHLVRYTAFSFGSGSFDCSCIWFIMMCFHYNLVHFIALASGLLSCVLFLCTPFSFFFHMVSCLHWQQKILVLLFFEGILGSWDSCSVLWSYRRVTFSTCVSKASIDQELLRVLWRRWPAWWKQQCRGKFRL